MNTATIILLLISSFISFFLIKHFLELKYRQYQMKKFKVNDICQIKDGEKKFYAKLSAWNSSSLFFLYEDQVVRYEWSNLIFNKSLTWRTHYEDSVKAMNGQKPTFDPIVRIISESSISDQLDPTFNKPLENLNETEANIALKHAVEKEQFEYAEKIRQHLTKFR